MTVDNILCLHKHKLVIDLPGELKTQRSLSNTAGTTRIIKLCWEIMPFFVFYLRHGSET